MIGDEFDLEETSCAENRELLETLESHPWWPAISWANAKLEELAPGYTITQIKEKFGGLRYYWALPENLSLPKTVNGVTYETSEEVLNRGTQIVTLAEFWVDGYENGLIGPPSKLSEEELLENVDLVSQALRRVFPDCGKPTVSYDKQEATWRVAPKAVVRLRQTDGLPRFSFVEDFELKREERFELMSLSVEDWAKRIKVSLED